MARGTENRVLKIIYVFMVGLVLLSSAVLAQAIRANQYITWGIGDDEIAIPTGCIITDAILTIESITPATATFYVHLLDNTNKGLFIGADSRSGNVFASYGVPLQGSFENGNFVCRLSAINDPQSPMGSIFANPCIVTLPDASSVTLSSAILELMDYAGNGGGFGIGIDVLDSSISISSIRLEMTLKSLDQAAPDSTLTFSFGTPGMTLYRSLDFQDGVLSDWSVVDEGGIDGPSRWAVLNGELVQSANIFSAEQTTDIRKKGTYLVYADGAGLDDYRVDFDMRSADDDAVGVMFRFKDNDDYYRFSWDKQRSYRRLVKNSGGIFTVLAQDAMPYVSLQNYHITIKIIDSSIVVLVDGEMVFSVDDNSVDSGSVAMYSWGNAGVYYDNIAISTYK